MFFSLRGPPLIVSKLPQGLCSSHGTGGGWMSGVREGERRWLGMGSWSSQSPRDAVPGWNALAGLKDKVTTSPDKALSPPGACFGDASSEVPKSGRACTQLSPSLGWGWHLGTGLWYLAPEKASGLWILPGERGEPEEQTFPTFYQLGGMVLCMLAAAVPYLDCLVLSVHQLEPRNLTQGWGSQFQLSKSLAKF